jgi:hypothetical protein
MYNFLLWKARIGDTRETRLSSVFMNRRTIKFTAGITRN